MCWRNVPGFPHTAHVLTVPTNAPNTPCWGTASSTEAPSRALGAVVFGARMSEGQKGAFVPSATDSERKRSPMRPIADAITRVSLAARVTPTKPFSGAVHLDPAQLDTAPAPLAQHPLRLYRPWVLQLGYRHRLTADPSRDVAPSQRGTDSRMARKRICGSNARLRALCRKRDTEPFRSNR